MKTAAYVFAIIFIGFVFYLGIHHFELPTYFFFDKTEKAQGTIIHTAWTLGIKGSRLQVATYEYQVNDSIYLDKFKVGQMQGLQKIGDKILVEYSHSNPEKNKVIGYYRN